MKTARQYVKEAQHDTRRRKQEAQWAREAREHRQREANRPLFEQGPAFVWHPSHIRTMGFLEVHDRTTDATQLPGDGLLP